MGNEQKILLERMQSFKFRWEEGLDSRFYMPSGGNFMNSEKIDVHYAVGKSKSEYSDVIEFWLNSMFNFLEDRFEDDALEQYAAQCQWEPIVKEIALAEIGALLLQIGAFENFEIEDDVQKSFLMLRTGEVTAFLMETENRYASFYWHAATT